MIPDNELAQLLSKAEDESKDKYNLLAVNLKTKGNLSKSIITSIAVNTDDFTSFYDEILKLKKLGYKFYNFSDFSSRKETFEKEEQLRVDKTKDELQKKQNEKKLADKKQTDKKIDTKNETP